MARKKKKKRRPRKPSPIHKDLFAAAGAGSLKSIASLLEGGADVQQTANHGWTPLLAAVYAGQRQAVGALLRAGADVNVRDSQGRTPLMIAARLQDAKILEQLLIHGADASYSSPHGECALGFAQHDCSPDHIELLREAGAPDSAGQGAFTSILKEKSRVLEEDLVGGGVRVSERSGPWAKETSGSALLNGFVRSEGLLSIANNWHSARPDQLTAMLMRDLIHSGNLRSEEKAAALAERFFGLMPTGALKLFSNTKALGDNCYSWSSVSRATFNAVMVGVSPEMMAIIWVDQEDD